MELTKLDTMILGALVDHGPFTEDDSDAKGSVEWQDAVGRLSNFSDRLARVPGIVLEKRVKSLIRSGHLDGSYRLVICERLAITDTGRLAVAGAVSEAKADQKREHRVAPVRG